MNSELKQKYGKLKAHIASLDSVVVALSGGIDSSLVAYVAAKVLGLKALAVTSGSESLKQADLELAKSITHEWGLNHLIIKTREIENANYRANPSDRCYYCKSTLYDSLLDIANDRGIKHIVNGTNLDDFGDYRPGLVAAEEHRVVAPLVESGFRKQDIRDLANHLKLRNANKPAAACLASRVPYGTAISKPLLAKIERAEEILSEYGFSQFRVRHHGDLARIEVPKEELSLALEHNQVIEQRIKACGYLYVTLDLGGFRSGSLNDTLPVVEVIARAS